MNGTNETEAGIETDLTHARATTLGSTRNRFFGQTVRSQDRLAESAKGFRGRRGVASGRDEIRRETEYVLGIVFLLFCGQLISFYCLSICSNSSPSVYLALSVF